MRKTEDGEGKLGVKRSCVLLGVSQAHLWCSTDLLNVNLPKLNMTCQDDKSRVNVQRRDVQNYKRGFQKQLKV